MYSDHQRPPSSSLVRGYSYLPHEMSLDDPSPYEALSYTWDGRVLGGPVFMRRQAPPDHGECRKRDKEVVMSMLTSASADRCHLHQPGFRNEEEHPSHFHE